MKLLNKAAIITGSRRGIGKVIAQTLSKEGANVVICDVSQEDCEKAADEVRAMGGKALAIKCDVTVKADVQNLVAKSIEEFGKVDILVNNAAYGVIKPFVRVTEQDWDQVFDVNVKGTFLCTQAVARNMIKNNGGRIINIASVASGGGGGCVPLMSAYVASKASVKALTETISVELADFGINVNAICPGTIDSGIVPQSFIDRSIKIIPKGRLGIPQDIANMVLFLASPESDYITGSVFYVDGGISKMAAGSVK